MIEEPVYVTVAQHNEVIKELAELSRAMNGTTINTVNGPQRAPGVIDLLGAVMKELKAFKTIMGAVGIVLLSSVIFDILKTVGVVHGR